MGKSRSPSKSFIVPYRPGLIALLDDVRNGRPLAPRGTLEERADTRVGLWTANRPGAAVVESTLIWGGFRVEPIGSGTLDVGAATTVFVVPGAEEQAGWVAAHLGAPMVELPAGVEAPEGYDVLVSVGEDAGTLAGAA